MRPIFLYAVGLCLALGAGEAFAAADTPSRDVMEIASSQNRGSLIHDFGLFAPPANPDNPAEAPSSASTVGAAEAVPELPTWAMMLLCLMGLGFAAFKKGRKDRLSPGIE
jgi:hypothetical protein